MQKNDYVVEPGIAADIDELEKLYDDLNDYLAATINYPGWIKVTLIENFYYSCL